VVTAEAVPIDKAKNAETVAEAVIVEENPNSEPG
jgi:hypothetical protein